MDWKLDWKWIFSILQLPSLLHISQPLFFREVQNLIDLSKWPPHFRALLLGEIHQVLLKALLILVRKI